MFIDDIKNRYTYLNTLKNVVWEEPADHTPNPDRIVIINGNMEPVLDKLTKERPTWRFKCTQRFFIGTGPFRASDFLIFDGDEMLGRLWLEHHWKDSTVRYFFDNFRLEKARMRSMSNFSTKPDVAAKRILKAFHLKTPSERTSEAMAVIREAASRVTSDAVWPLRRAKNVLECEVFQYIADHWDAIKPLLPNAANIDLPVMLQADKEATNLANALSNNEGTMVRIESNGTYLIGAKVDDVLTTQTMNDSTLSDRIRGALGLLKLVEDKTYIDGVGLRVNAYTYYITQPSLPE